MSKGKENKPSIVDRVRLSMEKMFGSAFGAQPNNVEGQMTIRTVFYKEQIEIIIKSLIKPEGWPDEWDVDYMLDALIYNGVFAVLDMGETYGVLPQNVAMWGYNIFLRPTGMIINNPVAGQFNVTRGIDAEIVYLKDDYNFKNFGSLIDIFAQRLANVDGSIDMNLMNTRLGYIFLCADAKQADEMKMLYDKISKGQPAVFYEEANLNRDIKAQVIDNNIKEHYIVDMLQTEKRAIMCELLTYLGVNNTNIEKKERLVSDEVNSNNDEISCNVKRIMENLDTCADRVNKMFGLNGRFEYPFWKERKVRQTNNGGNTDDRVL